ncbi:hypothetical protein Bdiaspc4_37150 [Bradyrhizobium diazoefficiens]|nr:hypothetical protein Bdiaspc4_37150 [Bradyrhizobium diazoefficiens]
MQSNSIRHSGATRSIELWCAIAHLRISRFRVRLFEPPRNDGVGRCRRVGKAKRAHHFYFVCGETVGMALCAFAHPTASEF